MFIWPFWLFVCWKRKCVLSSFFFSPKFFLLMSSDFVVGYLCQWCLLAYNLVGRKMCTKLSKYLHVWQKPEYLFIKKKKYHHHPFQLLKWVLPLLWSSCCFIWMWKWGTCSLPVVDMGKKITISSLVAVR